MIKVTHITPVIDSNGRLDAIEVNEYTDDLEHFRALKLIEVQKYNRKVTTLDLTFQIKKVTHEN